MIKVTCQQGWFVKLSSAPCWQTALCAGWQVQSQHGSGWTLLRSSLTRWNAQKRHWLAMTLTAKLKVLALTPTVYISTRVFLVIWNNFTFSLMWLIIASFTYLNQFHTEHPFREHVLNVLLTFLDSIVMVAYLLTFEMILVHVVMIFLCTWPHDHHMIRVLQAVIWPEIGLHSPRLIQAERRQLCSLNLLERLTLQKTGIKST